MEAVKEKDKTNILDTLDNDASIPLSVPAIIYHFKKDRTQATIARIHKITPQAVSDYIKRHNEALSILVPKNDELMAHTAKYVGYKAMKVLDELLDGAGQKDLMAVNAISGTHIEKYRLLSDQSTSNFNFSVLIQGITDKNKKQPPVIEADTVDK